MFDLRSKEKFIFLNIFMIYIVQSRQKLNIKQTKELKVRLPCSRDMESKKSKI